MLNRCSHPFGIGHGVAVIANFNQEVALVGAFCYTISNFLKVSRKLYWVRWHLSKEESLEWEVTWSWCCTRAQPSRDTEQPRLFPASTAPSHRLSLDT